MSILADLPIPAGDPGPATTSDYAMLIAYFTIALGISFLCSLSEAVILSVPRSFTVRLRKEGRRTGRMLDEMKASIDRPLAAILTLNTIAHTLGAAGVGAQSLAIFGEAWVMATSIVLTLAILVLSEIIPKTWGAVSCVPLAPFVTWLVWLMIIVTYPLVWTLEFVSDTMFPRSRDQPSITREDIAVITELSQAEGSLAGHESRVIQNLLRLSERRVKDVMTPRTVISMLQRDMSAEEAINAVESNSFSRFPVYGQSPDEVIGIVLRRDLSDAVRTGKGARPITEFARRIRAVPEMATLDNILWTFFSTGHHMFHVVDEYGGTAGIVTLEDAIETMLGHEIVDETDSVVDMRQHARLVHRKARLEQMRAAARAKRSGTIPPPMG